MPIDRSHLASLVDDFERLGNDTAIVALQGLRERRTTYRELASVCRRVANALAQRTLAKGDRAILWGENSADWVASFFGCALNGVVPVPVDVASSAEFVGRIIQEVTPGIIFADRDKIRNLQAKVPAIALQDIPVLLDAEPPNFRPVDLTESDQLQIIFTSGTTGEPKGIIHTHLNVLASLRPIETEIAKYLRYERFVHPLRILHTLPLSHVFGQFMGLWIPALLGAEIHYQQRLVASELIEQIRRHRISVLAAVPRVLDLMQSELKSRLPDLLQRTENAIQLKWWQRWWHFRDIHRLFGWKFWAIVCGGASLTPSSEAFWNALGFVLIQGYGMTETTALVSLNHPFRLARGTIGQVLPGREVRLSEEGEVLVRGQTISHTVWQAGEARKAESEWLQTGDLADFDEAGNLRFRGRKKDVIVTSSGLNIYPEDLEAALVRQSGVKASAVVEIATDHGPEPFAAIVTSAGIDARTVIDSANAQLASYQQIRHWIQWPEPDLPRTSNGKILKREVARRVNSGELNDVGTVSGEQLNLDSLGRVQLQAEVEQQFGVSLDDDAVQTVTNMEDVQQLVRQASGTSRAPRSSVDHTYPRWPWNPFIQGLRWLFLESVALPLLRFLTKARTQSTIQQWPRSPVLIVANHVTAYDVAFILYALPRKIRMKVTVAMSGEVILDWRRARNQGHWFLNLVAPLEYLIVTALFNVFPLPQSSGFRRSFRHAGEAMDRGYNVIVFPEGRRSDDGIPLPFKGGAGLLWKDLGTPALPVRLNGLGEIKARRGRWFRTGEISVSVGDVIPAQPDKSPQELTEILRRGVFES